MKYLIFILTIFLAFLTPSGKAHAQLRSSFFNDTVIKIKDDDDGKLFVLSKTKSVLYLRFNNPGFDSIFATLTNSQAFNAPIKITTDSQFNILKAD